MKGIAHVSFHQGGGLLVPAYTPYEEVKEFIKQRIVQENQNDVLEKYVTDLKAKAKITINAELLKGEAEKGGPAAKVDWPGILAKTLPHLPGQDDETPTATLDLNGQAIVRVRPAEQPCPTSILQDSIGHQSSGHPGR